MKILLAVFGLLICSTALFANVPTDDDTPERGLLTGQVRTASGKPAEFANVALRGTRFGTTTDANGRFSLRVPPGQHTLQVSMVGLATQEQPVLIEANQTQTVELTLAETTQQLEAAVVVAHNAQTYVSKLPSASLRLNAPLIEVPQNIAVVTKQAIKDFGITGTAEMARMTSGIVKRYGGANDFSFNIRGTDATNNVFRNGVGSYWWNQQADAFMLERVEFVKGPAGFMIGNSEPSGLINEVTKQADGQRVREVEVGYGSWNLLRGGIDIGDKFSPTSRFSYRLVAGGQRTDAFYDFYRASRTYLLPSVRYTYPKGHVQAELIRMDGHVQADNSSNISFDGRTALLPLTFNATDPNAVRGIETDDQYLRLSHTHQLGRGWQLRTQLADVRGQYRGEAMYVSQPSMAFDTLFREVYGMNWRNSLRAAQSFVDGSFQTGPKVKHSILAGLDYGRTRVVSAWGDYNPDGWGTQFPLVVRNPVYNLTREASANITLNPADDWGTEWTALYVQDHIKLYDKLIVTLASRLSHTKSWASYDSTTVYDNKLTPRFGLTYLMGRNTSIYALFDETFLPQTGRKEDQTNARPLTGTNIELGMKAQLLGQRLFWNASLFRTVKNNVLVQNPQTQLYVERGQITSQGFETDLTGNLSNNIVVNLNYTFTDARVTQDADSAIIGFRNYAVARHAGNAMIRYKFLAGRLAGVSVGAGAQLMGHRSAVWAGFTDPNDKDKAAPAYTIFDLNAAWERGRFSIRANVFNLLNRQFMDSAWWNSATDTQPGFFTYAPSQPINFRIQTAVRF
jgi:iron complex outermembrane recepter protein